MEIPKSSIQLPQINDGKSDEIKSDLGNPGRDVNVQSTKIAIDADGVIVYRAG